MDQNPSISLSTVYLFFISVANLFGDLSLASYTIEILQFNTPTLVNCVINESSASSVCSRDLKTIIDPHTESRCQLTKPFSQQLSSGEREEREEKEREQASSRGRPCEPHRKTTVFRNFLKIVLKSNFIHPGTTVIIPNGSSHPSCYNKLQTQYQCRRTFQSS